MVVRREKMGGLGFVLSLGGLVVLLIGFDLFGFNYN